MPLELAVSLPATAAVVVLFVYLRSAYRTLTGDHPLIRTPDVAYAITAALRGQPLLLNLCWSCVWQRVVAWVDARLSRLGDRLSPIESHDHLSEWWDHHVSYNRELTRYNSYRPRHSYERWQNPETIEDRMESAEWRLHWARWDTQFWPILATRGDAYDTVDVSTGVESYAR